MLNIVDKLIIMYELLLTVHVLIFIENVENFSSHLQMNAIIVFWIVGISWLANKYEKQPYKFLHTFYPVWLLIWHYPQACDLRYTVIPFSLDPLLIKWDLAIFRIPLYEVIPQKLNLLGLEIFHLFYFGYYLSLAVPAWIVYKQGHPKIAEFMFVIMATNFIHQWMVILIPADGPVPIRADIIPEGVLMIPIMNLVYELHTGGGAMPSLHAAGAIVTCSYANLFLPKWKTLWIILFCGITAATFVCCYHYPIDSLVGIFTGILCYRYLPGLYDQITDPISTIQPAGNE